MRRNVVRQPPVPKIQVISERFHIISGPFERHSRPARHSKCRFSEGDKRWIRGPIGSQEAVSGICVKALRLKSLSIGSYSIHIVKSSALRNGG
jgi:hypothetical protein